MDEKSKDKKDLNLSDDIKDSPDVDVSNFIRAFFSGGGIACTKYKIRDMVTTQNNKKRRKDDKSE